jgi:DnaJ-class molecular chaperone
MTTEKRICPRCTGDGTVEIGRIHDDLTYSVATCMRCYGMGWIEVDVTPGDKAEEARQAALRG